MQDERWESGRERECACNIKVENSIVIHLCGELEFGVLTNCIQSALEGQGDRSLVPLIASLHKILYYVLNAPFFFFGYYLIPRFIDKMPAALNRCCLQIIYFKRQKRFD